MRKLLIASAAAVTLTAGQALAADLGPPYYEAPAPPVLASGWTGFYGGVDVGARLSDPTWTTDSWTDQGTACPFTLFCSLPISPDNPALSNSATYDGIGFRAGGYFGYNLQFAPTWVTGIEGDFGWGNNTVSQHGVAPGPLPLMSGDYPAGIGDLTSVNTKWDASIRARIGYLVMPSFLVYATGGPAWQSVSLRASCASLCVRDFGTTASPTFASTDTTTLGFTVGAGAEIKMWSNWILRAEYTYADFNRICFNYAYLTAAPAGVAADGGIVYATHLDLNTQTFVVGLAYKFGH